MKRLSQLDLLYKIQDESYVNVVTCGTCGDVFLHERHETELKCPHCDAEHDPSDCPDLFYEGWDDFKDTVEEAETLIWEYSISTPSLWASFDYGEVEAKTEEEAMEKAIAKLEYDFKKVNEILGSCDPTIGFTVEFDKTQVEVTEKAN